MGFTETLADEVADNGVKVWAMCASMVGTAMARKTSLGASVRRRALKPEAVANVITAPATGTKRAASGSAINTVRRAGRPCAN